MMTDQSLDVFLNSLRSSELTGDLGETSTSMSPEFRVEEIGDGNLNDVHRVISNKDANNTVIIKHAPPYIKCLGPDFPLSTCRSESEYAALRWFHRIAEGSVPEPYFHSTPQHLSVMEDLRGYEVMRTQLVRGELDLQAARKIVRDLINVHLQTREGSIGRDKKEELQNTEMVSLTRDYVFTFPFRRDHPTNRCSERVSAELSLLYDNAELLRSVAELTTIFLEKKECLVHGDLHTGSIMVKGPYAKMIDLEFAFVGPMGFDLGVLLANFLFSYHAHRLKPRTDTKFHEKVRTAAVEAISEYFGKAESIMRRDRLSTLLHEVVGFAGCELIRRIVGAAHVEDLNGIPEAEVECLKLGVKLILEHKQLVFQSIAVIPQMFGL